ncbi:MAG: metal-dependent hydrolase [Anaeromyxobacter sp.]|nr:metal-dependent hydrolase [Anaeromyxobacter sp.]MBL0277917.1 metal-dependent hydrolase [Anaeromyxobacter sp.]
MPSIGHVVVGLAAGRWYARAGGSRAAASAVFVALSTFQDLDFLARRLGAPAGSAWLHRGAIHALATAALAGLAAAALVGGQGRSRAAMALAGALVAASHGLLDTLTGGGAGVMLAWPLTADRFLAPWTWMPAAPMGLRLLSSRGASVALRELVLFGPLLLYVAWPGRPVSALLLRRWCAPSRGAGEAGRRRAAP